VRLGDALLDADIYLWDYTPGFELKGSIAARKSAQHIVLADPKNLDAVEAVQYSACVLLKPLNPLTLKAFLDLAVKSWEACRQASEAQALRNDRDALLQYVLGVNLKLQEYDQERSTFLARVLHDFQTPLTALVGYCGLLAAGKFGSVSEAQRELLDRMCYSTKRLAGMAGGALELLSQGRFTNGVNLRQADIAETVNRALHDIYPFVKDKNLRINVHITAPEGILLFEPEQIQQVLTNLLENSCKFTPTAGVIVVRGYPFYHAPWEQQLPSPTTSMINAYRLDICDSGSGVSPELAERIFEPYMSYPNGNDRSGAGLGLAICRAILSAHRGVIWATPSEDEGKFSFILPTTSSKPNSVQKYSDAPALEFEHAAYQ
jgi:signal transduction histidine kinase